MIQKQNAMHEAWNAKKTALEAGRSKEIDSSLGSPEEMTPRFQPSEADVPLYRYMYP